MKPFILEDRLYTNLEEVKRELLAEAIEGCIYMMFLNQPNANESTVLNALTWYSERINLFTENISNTDRTYEDEQILKVLRNLSGYLNETIKKPGLLKERRIIKERIVNEISFIVNGLEKKPGTIRGSYDEKYLLDYSSSLE